MGLAADDDGPKDRLRARLSKITSERAKLQERLEKADDNLAVGAALLESALRLLEQPHDLYRQSGPKFRRILNQAIFEKLYVFEDEVTDHVFREPFAELHEADTVIRLGNDDGVGKRRRQLDVQMINGSNKAALLVAALSSDDGSSKTAMVGLLGSYSNPDIISRLQRILAGQGRDPVSDRTVRSPGRKQWKLTDEEVQELVTARQEGAEIDELAERFGIGRNTVMAHLERQGVPGRRWPGYTLSPERLEEAGRLYESGLRLELVAQQFGVTKPYLRKVLPAAGLTIRKPGRQRQS